MTDEQYERDIAAIEQVQRNQIAAGIGPGNSLVMRLRTDAYSRLCEREHRRAYDAAPTSPPSSR